MRNWSVDLSKMNKKSSEYKIWHLEQMINFGLNGEKISPAELRKYFTSLKLDPEKKKYMKFLLSDGTETN